MQQTVQTIRSLSQWNQWQQNQVQIWTKLYPVCRVLFPSSCPGPSFRGGCISCRRSGKAAVTRWMEIWEQEIGKSINEIISLLSTPLWESKATALKRAPEYGFGKGRLERELGDNRIKGNYLNCGKKNWNFGNGENDPQTTGLFTAYVIPSYSTALSYMVLRPCVWRKSLNLRRTLFFFLWNKHIVKHM